MPGWNFREVARSAIDSAEFIIDGNHDRDYPYEAVAELATRVKALAPLLAEVTGFDASLGPPQWFDAPTTVNGTDVLNLRPIDVEECACAEPHGPSSLLGHVYFCGAFCHVHMLRVVDDESDGQRPICDPHDRWADVCVLDEVAFEPVRVPGYEGEWVLWLHPGER